MGEKKDYRDKNRWKEVLESDKRPVRKKQEKRRRCIIAYVYAEDGVKHNINDISKEYIDRWKQEIYQKTQRVDLTFWYGGENCIGKKKEMEEEEKNEDDGIMKEPQMIEKELVTIVNKQRNGKATGVDGVRAELLKFLTKIKPSGSICHNAVTDA